ncbi:unnamed protein product, partial [Symbiodinium necroappetens]
MSRLALLSTRKLTRRGVNSDGVETYRANDKLRMSQKYPRKFANHFASAFSILVAERVPAKCVEVEPGAHVYASRSMELLGQELNAPPAVRMLRSLFATYEVPAQTYRNMEAKVRRMVDPKKRSGKVTASEALRKKWFESSEARKKLVLEMVNCGGDKAKFTARLKHTHTNSQKRTELTQRIKGAVQWCTHKKRRATFVRKDKYNPTDHEYLVDVSSKKSTTKESEDKLVDETDLGENERDNVAFGFDSGSEGPNSDAETADDASSASSEPARKKSKSNKKRARAASSTPSPKKPKSKPTRGLSKADLELQVATE